MHDRGEGDVEQGVVEVAEEGANEEGGDDGFGGKAGAVGEVFVFGGGVGGGVHGVLRRVKGAVARGLRRRQARCGQGRRRRAGGCAGRPGWGG